MAEKPQDYNICVIIGLFYFASAGKMAALTLSLVFICLTLTEVGAGECVFFRAFWFTVNHNYAYLYF